MSLIEYISFIQIIIMAVLAVAIIYVRDCLKSIKEIAWLGTIIYLLASFLMVFYADDKLFVNLEFGMELLNGFHFTKAAKFFVIYNGIAGICYMLTLNRVSEINVFKYVLSMMTAQFLVNVITLEKNIVILVVALELMIIPMFIMETMYIKRKVSFWYVILTSLTFVSFTYIFIVDKSRSDISLQAIVGAILFVGLVLATSLRGILLSHQYSEHRDRVSFELTTGRTFFLEMLYFPVLLMFVFTVTSRYAVYLLPFTEFVLGLFIILMIIQLAYGYFENNIRAKRMLLCSIFYLVALVGVWKVNVVGGGQGSGFIVSVYLYMMAGLSSYFIGTIESSRQVVHKVSGNRSLLEWMERIIRWNLKGFPPLGIFLASLVFTIEIFKFNCLYGTILAVIFMCTPFLLPSRNDNC